MEEDNIRLARRISGGGAVFHDNGNLNFSFILSRDIYDVTRQCGVIINALKSLGLDAQISGRNDMTIDDKKFSGNAFCFKGHNALHHGTVLIGADKEKMSRYLTVSTDKIKSKGVTSVKSRVVNLCDLKPELTVEIVKDAVAEAFKAEYGSSCEHLHYSDHAKSMWPTDDNFRNIISRNGSWEWNYGESPDFDIHLKNRFSWGGVELYLKLDEGIISRADVYSDALCEEIISALPPLLIGERFIASELSQKLNNSKEQLANLSKDQGVRDFVMDDIASWLSGELR
jgi:lipoate-protein ligase A